jgi:phosphoglycerate dehydrogenase-like enzyme
MVFLQRADQAAGLVCVNMPMPNIVSLIQLNSAQAQSIRDINAEIRLFEAGDWFQDEYAESWPSATVERYVSVSGSRNVSRADRDELLSSAEIVICGFPFPVDLCARAPRLRWLHQTPAGASNLRHGDVWGSKVAVTTSRGYGETLAIAEYALAGIMYFAKAFDRAALDREQASFNHQRYAPTSLGNKTLCVIGAGGIGRQIARLGKALGIRTLGTRGSLAEVTQDADFDALGGPGELHGFLGESDFVAVSCQWTAATTELLNAAAFAAMKPGTILVNVARGEIIDEAALVAALDSGRLRGAVLDVFVGEFDGPPPAVLWQRRDVLITPHTSAQTDRSQWRSMDLFNTNLRRFLAAEPLENQIDWELGY